MDGIGGTIKNAVYRKVKTGKVIVNSAKEFHEAANKFIPSIKSLFQTELLKEPADIESAPKIPDTLKIHKWSRNTSVSGECEISFFYLSNDQAPFTKQTYQTRLRCGHEEKYFESLAMLKNTCAKCLICYDDKNEREDWLKCPSCLQWYHESCF